LKRHEEDETKIPAIAPKYHMLLEKVACLMLVAEQRRAAYIPMDGRVTKWPRVVAQARHDDIALQDDRSVKWVQHQRIGLVRTRMLQAYVFSNEMTPCSGGLRMQAANYT
jgi:hypothetical protein